MNQLIYTIYIYTILYIRRITRTIWYYNFNNKSIIDIIDFCIFFHKLLKHL